MTTRATLGAKGETLAAEYLERQGFVILERNARLQHKEIDIIARDGRTVVFVEVKTRSSDAYGVAEESITKSKLRHLETALHWYSQAHNLTNVRIDAIAITATTAGKAKLRHFKNLSVASL